MPTMGVTKFQQFFRAAAEVAVDKNDLKRYNDFIDQKLYDMLLLGQVAAKAGNRDVIQPYDLPITKGLQECIRVFRALDEEIELRPLLEQLTARPPLDLVLAEETEEWLASVAGGMSVALARSFRIIDPERRHPLTPDWDRVLNLFDLLL